MGEFGVRVRVVSVLKVIKHEDATSLIESYVFLLLERLEVWLRVMLTVDRRKFTIEWRVALLGPETSLFHVMSRDLVVGWRGLV